MAGTVTEKQAEDLFDKYNKDGNNELTVEEVKQCLQEVYETVDEVDIQMKYAYFGQKEAKSLKKKEFIEGMVRADKCTALEKLFKKMDADHNNSLSRRELESGLVSEAGIDPEQATIILEELEYDDDGKYDIDEFLQVFAFSEYFQCAHGN